MANVGMNFAQKHGKKPAKEQVRDERRDIGLGPEHDWSSHAADAFGLMGVCAEEAGTMRAFNRRIEYPKYGIA
jgi:phage terminase large subunit